MSVTASSGSPRVSPQLYDTLPLSNVRKAEQQDRFPDKGELDNLINFFQSGQNRVDAAKRLSANADAIVAKAANRIFVGGTPLSYLDKPLTPGALGSDAALPLAADQAAFASSIQTFVQGSGGGGLFGRIREGFSAAADVQVVIPAGFSPIDISRYGNSRMRKSLRDLGWFLRYVGYALVAGDPSILAVNARGLKDILEKGCSLPATNLALQEMRAASADLFEDNPTARALVISCFNVLIDELAVATPSTRQRLGSPQQQGLQLPAIYALAAEGAQRFVMRPGLSGSEKAEIIRAAQRQVFERDIAKAYSQNPCSVEASQLKQGQISMREFIRSLGKSKEYRTQFFGGFSNSRAVELAFRHFLGRGISSLEEFRKYFAIVSAKGLNGLVDSLINGMEYARVFGEETVPYLRDLGEEAQESAGWGSNRKLFQFSAPFEGAPQYVTLYASYRQPLADQHVYGGGNDPIGLQYGAIFPSSTASVATRPAPHSYRTRRLLVGNGMAGPGQMDSPGFRTAQPRRVGPRQVRLQQIATGGSSKPKRGGQASIRNTESSTQAVINAVYVQVLGSSGYEGDRITTEENKLENGNISLREFIRMVARSKAFRRRYWSNLYITKAIEVMHRRLLGRPTFGRWEINGYFDIAARKGFYGVVDALINSKEYLEAYGEDMVPYERFITPNDLNSRRVPALRQPLDLAAIVEPQKRYDQQKRPELYKTSVMNTPGSLTPRNFLAQSNSTPGMWRADVAGQEANQTVETTFRFSRNTNRWQPAPYQTNASSLATGLKQGFALKQETELNKIFRLAKGASNAEREELISAVYRQLLNRIPFASERLIEAESKLCDGQFDVAKFVEQVAAGDLFQQRLAQMAPMQSAAAAHLALLGRAPEPLESGNFLACRAQQGQLQAVASLLNSENYKISFGSDTVPYLQGLGSQSGVSVSNIVRTATLYGGNSGLTPSPKKAI